MGTKITTINNVVIMPFKGDMDNFTGGLYRENHAFIEGSVIYRHTLGDVQNPEDHLSGTYIWGGCLFSHFGHFIWESLSRLYAIRKCKGNLPILFISPNKLFNYHTIFFKTIGINNDIKIIYKPTSVEHIIYSEEGSSLKHLLITDEQIDALGYFQHKKNSTAENIWVSRSLLNNRQAKVTNELYIEDELKKNGFRIIHPEKLHIHEQINLLGNSNIVAGFDGSAWFSLLFSKNINSKVFVFNRWLKIISTIEYILKLKNINHKIYELPVKYISGTWAWKNFEHLEPDKIISILIEAIKN